MTVDKSIFIKNVYYMLAYAFQRLNKEDYHKVAKEKFDNIHDLFAEIISIGVSNQLKQGLYRDYVPIQDNLSVMRGKLNINETLRLKVQNKQQLACEYDEFSENNIYNQILKMTMYRLIRAKQVKQEYRQKLKKLIIWFDNVSLIQPNNVKWGRLTYQRSNSNYELLINICYLLNDGMLQTTEDGKYKLLSFSDEQMNMLFERFVFEYYAQEHKQLNVSAPTMRWTDESEEDNPLIRFLPVMKTDIVLKDKSGTKTLIIDTKYYKTIMTNNREKEKLRSEHLYQIFAYVKNMEQKCLGTVSGLLLYAKTDEEVFPDNGTIKPFRSTGNSIGVRTLDLNKDFESIRAQLDDIAREFISN